MPSRHYYNRRRKAWGRSASLEMVATAVVVVVVIALVVVFLFVYHDFPLRIGGP